MSRNREQTYASHRRYHPLTHFFIFPIVFINFLLQIYNLFVVPSIQGVWHLFVAAALIGLAIIARLNALRVQDRVIRLEEQLRLARLLPEDLRTRAGDFSTGQLLAMRFCCDEELPELARAVLAGEVKGRENIKKRIKTWRGDFHRV